MEIEKLEIEKILAISKDVGSSILFPNSLRSFENDETTVKEYLDEKFPCICSLSGKQCGGSFANKKVELLHGDLNLWKSRSVNNAKEDQKRRLRILKCFVDALFVNKFKSASGSYISIMLLRFINAYVKLWPEDVFLFSKELEDLYATFSKRPGFKFRIGDIGKTYDVARCYLYRIPKFFFDANDKIERKNFLMRKKDIEKVDLCLQNNRKGFILDAVSQDVFVYEILGHLTLEFCVNSIMFVCKDFYSHCVKKLMGTKNMPCRLFAVGDWNKETKFPSVLKLGVKSLDNLLVTLLTNNCFTDLHKRALFRDLAVASGSMDVILNSFDFILKSTKDMEQLKLFLFDFYDVGCFKVMKISQHRRLAKYVAKQMEKFDHDEVVEQCLRPLFEEVFRPLGNYPNSLELFAAWLAFENMFPIIELLTQSEFNMLFKENVSVNFTDWWASEKEILKQNLNDPFSLRFKMVVGKSGLSVPRIVFYLIWKKWGFKKMGPYGFHWMWSIFLAIKEKNIAFYSDFIVELFKVTDMDELVKFYDKRGMDIFYVMFHMNAKPVVYHYLAQHETMKNREKVKEAGKDRFIGRINPKWDNNKFVKNWDGKNVFSSRCNEKNGS